MKIKKILLPVDGSDGSLIALETARDMAKKFDAQIILLNVVDIAFRGSMYEFYAYDPSMEKSLVDRGCRILDDTEAKFERSGYKAPIHSDRREVKDEKNQTRYEYHTDINLDHGELHHPASAGEDPMFEGTEFAREKRREDHHPMHETQINEGKLNHPAGTGEDPDFEGTAFDQNDRYKSEDGHDNAGYRTDHPQKADDKKDSTHMSRNDQMLREDKDKGITSTQLNNPQNMGDQGYYNADADPRLKDSYQKPAVNSGQPMAPAVPPGNYDAVEPKSDHNSAVPERRGPVGVENSPRINTEVSPELKGDVHPNQKNPNFVDEESNANQMGLENEKTRHATRGYDNQSTDSKGDDITIKKVSLTGQPGEVIVEFSDRHNIDLIVMATRGSSGMKRFIAGSVTNYVLHHSRVPLLAIPVKDDEKEDEKK